jgi:hypothetical protein
MEELDFLEGFDDISLDEPIKKEEQDDDALKDKGFKKDFGSGSKNTNYKKTKEKPINLFKEKPEPEEIDPNNVNIDKSVIVAVANPNVKIPDDKLAEIEELIKELKDKGYKVRGMCNSFNQLYPIIYKHLGYDNLIVVKPWKNYCKVNKLQTWLPSNKNIRAAVAYFKNFDKLPSGIKYINSAIITLLFGRFNNSASKFILVYDPYKKDEKDKIDWQKSKDTGVFYWFPRTFKEIGFNLFNLYNKNEINELRELL